jgi:hypothetical protein
MTDDPSHRWHALVGYKTEMEWSMCTTTSMNSARSRNWSEEAGLEHDYRDHDNPGDSVVRHNSRAIIRAVGGARTRSAQQSPTHSLLVPGDRSLSRHPQHLDLVERLFLEEEAEPIGRHRGNAS